MRDALDDGEILANGRIIGTLCYGDPPPPIYREGQCKICGRPIVKKYADDEHYCKRHGQLARHFRARAQAYFDDRRAREQDDDID
jgi:hypothetical protein